jgi:hypothetical protein
LALIVTSPLASGGFFSDEENEHDHVARMTQSMVERKIVERIFASFLCITIAWE